MNNELAVAIGQKMAEYDFHDDFNHTPTALMELATNVADILAHHDPLFDCDAFLKAAKAI